ncbi:nitrite reductase small subunit NirD [Rouxiella sp. T17]|uniref:nitrite reductase small subunit NirD n=1 Tax=Rouxiella sp. T17 TaxID=3085684 RepID=UPI002FCC36D2
MNIWTTICQQQDILPGCGIAALWQGRQIAIFRPTSTGPLYALDNIDPFALASVLSRGIIAEHQGEFWVVSPLKKQHFRLRDGLCMEDAAFSVDTFALRCIEGVIMISAANNISD